MQHLFFAEGDGCLALFELLHYPALRESARLDRLALMNAIKSYHPEYVMENNLLKQQGLNDSLGLMLEQAGIKCELSGSAKNMVSMFAKAGWSL